MTPPPATWIRSTSTEPALRRAGLLCLRRDNANRADTVTVAGDNYAFTYWDTGVPKRIGYPNLVAEEYWLTPRGGVDSLVTAYWDDPTIRSIRCRNRYTYNGLGDRLSHYVSLNRPGTTALTGTINYTYDGLRRLKQVKNPTGFNGGDTITYTYDKMGNRTYKDNKKISDITYTYNQANNQLASRTGGMNYTYDDNGNMTQWANGDYYITNYGYDCENRLTKVTWDGSADSTLFFYNGDGVRLKKVGTKDSSTQYLVDGMNSVVERTSTGRMRYKYIYANGMMLSRIDSSGTKLWYGHDALGSISGITDTYGDAVKSYLYDEFGDSLGAWGSTQDKWRYTGQEYDLAPTYAYNLRAREYYPKLGRFGQNDPIGNAGGSLNWYLYVRNNPVNWTDITGKVCGSEDIDALVPDQWGDLFDFTGACSEHDGCYGDCDWGPPKWICDLQFLNNMYASCRNSSNPSKCREVAETYFAAVWSYGFTSFQNARAKCDECK